MTIETTKKTRTMSEEQTREEQMSLKTAWSLIGGIVGGYGGMAVVVTFIAVHLH